MGARLTHEVCCSLYWYKSTNNDANARLPDSVSLEHVPFGLVQGEDGKKFKTRSGDTGVYPHFTCFTRTKVQILTLTRLPDAVSLEIYLLC